MKILKIKTLKHGYHDPCDVILHAAFTCLVRFVEELEKQKTYKIDPSRAYFGLFLPKKEYDNLYRLYNWWTKERPNRKTPLDTVEVPDYVCDEFGMLDIPDESEAPEWNKAVNEHNRLERAWNLEDQAMLFSLCVLRQWLWI